MLLHYNHTWFLLMFRLKSIELIKKKLIFYHGQGFQGTDVHDDKMWSLKDIHETTILLCGDLRKQVLYSCHIISICSILLTIPCLNRWNSFSNIAYEDIEKYLCLYLEYAKT